MKTPKTITMSPETRAKLQELAKILNLVDSRGTDSIIIEKAVVALWESHKNSFLE